MVTSLFISEIKGKSSSIERLISDLLQRQTDLSSRLALLERTESTSQPENTVDPCPGCSSCASFVKGKKRRSLPLYDSQDDATDLELSNFFAPLAALPTAMELLLQHPELQSLRLVSDQPWSLRPGGCTAPYVEHDRH